MIERHKTVKTRGTSAVIGALVKTETFVSEAVKKASFSSRVKHLRIKSVPKDSFFKG